nr:hypothetical protein [Massilia cavernae]
MHVNFAGLCRIPGRRCVCAGGRTDGGGATAGFLIWNYPVGLIFLGDGGAYFIGFMLGELALLLVMRNPRCRPGTRRCC